MIAGFRPQNGLLRQPPHLPPLHHGSRPRPKHPNPHHLPHVRRAFRRPRPRHICRLLRRRLGPSHLWTRRLSPSHRNLYGPRPRPHHRRLPRTIQKLAVDNVDHPHLWRFRCNLCLLPRGILQARDPQTSSSSKRPSTPSKARRKDRPGDDLHHHTFPPDQNAPPRTNSSGRQHLLRLCLRRALRLFRGVSIHLSIDPRLYSRTDRPGIPWYRRRPVPGLCDLPPAGSVGVHASPPKGQCGARAQNGPGHDWVCAHADWVVLVCVDVKGRDSLDLAHLGRDPVLGGTGAVVRKFNLSFLLRIFVC